MVVLGDLNARVGDVVVENVVGRYGASGRNDWKEPDRFMQGAKSGSWKKLVHEARYPQVLMGKDCPRCSG